MQRAPRCRLLVLLWRPAATGGGAEVRGEGERGARSKADGGHRRARGGDSSLCRVDRSGASHQR
eukprot:CAMPEP_0179841038 /NCGR_PEP_ID=MMETSP0982-20121206/2280_1 /TAXON_ID=483367 /ORGANISM="non described non described, Strain CCMP 2436" /LENGTH=63 /DNA_ID=CAMNT_0021725017 /DNA_START=101 /DNA_END=292 /DNA_ORIENTATION=-